MSFEEELLSLSGLQHLVFCARRAALVLLEGIWADNIHTVSGNLSHERVHQPIDESRPDVRIVRGLALRSLKLGIVGKADVVEFHRLRDPPGREPPAEHADRAIQQHGIKGFWRPFPVEYKVGKRRRERAYEVQLCAQGMCLEEMLGTEVPMGAIYFGKTGRRLEVPFDTRLRAETEAAAKRLREIVALGETPKARYEKKCDKCSLVDLCLPKVSGSKRSAKAYLERVVQKMGESVS